MTNGRIRTLVILLVCSLGINLLLVGGFIGFRMVERPNRPFPTQLGWMVKHLDSESRRGTRSMMRDHARKARPLQKEMHRAQKALEDAIIQDPLDEAQISLAMAELQKSSEALQTQMHRQMIDLLHKLTPEQRKQAMTFLHQRHREPSRRRRDGPSR